METDMETEMEREMERGGRLLGLVSLVEPQTCIHHLLQTL